ncbi:hypothetical protein O3M35_010040 [Rhynocoris fuscipes]|uniref:DUF4214 domain-containing protein n=1 Tax=Rhynocoris fuscipes TaxID=488301 RepID=A0AAW1CZS5_9HEMI
MYKTDPINRKWLERIVYIEDVDEFNYVLENNTSEVILGFIINNSFHVFDEEIEEKVLINYELSREYLMEFYLGFAMREGSVYNKGINRYIAKFRESGLTGHIINMKIFEKVLMKPSLYTVGQRDRNTFKGHKSLTMNELKGIFMVMIIGHIMAGMFALLEQWYFHYFH